MTAFNANLLRASTVLLCLLFHLLQPIIARSCGIVPLRYEIKRLKEIVIIYTFITIGVPTC